MRDGSHRRLLRRRRRPPQDRLCLPVVLVRFLLVIYSSCYLWCCSGVNVPVLRPHVSLLLLLPVVVVVEATTTTTSVTTPCHGPSRILPTATRSRRSWHHHHRLDRPLDFLQVVSTTSTSTSSSPGNHHHHHIIHNNDVISSEKERPSTSNIFWPPWPFNLLQPSSSPNDDLVRMDHPPTVLDRLRRVTTQSTRVAIRSVQELGSQLLGCHAPPVLPPLILYALWPTQTTTATTTTTTIIPLWSNAGIRNCVGMTLTVAILSWAHAAWHRQRCPLTPLPGLHDDGNELPPFLPDATGWYDDPTTTSTTRFTVPEHGTTGSSSPSSADITGENHDQENSSTTTDDHDPLASPRRWYWRQFRSRVTVPPHDHFRRRLDDWQHQRHMQRAERKNAHRLVIYDELLRWQQQQQTTTTRTNQRPASSSLSWNHRWNPWRTLKQRFDRSTLTNGSHHDQDHNATRLGCALVTGASQGIGRAISVELARWQVPLILVARDAPALVALATDLQACYGIDCTVLSADLSRPNASEQIYQTVTKAGLKVDVSTNICYPLWLWNCQCVSHIQIIVFLVYADSSQQCRHFVSRRDTEYASVGYTTYDSSQYRGRDIVNSFVWS